MHNSWNARMYGGGGGGVCVCVCVCVCVLGGWVGGGGSYDEGFPHW